MSRIRFVISYLYEAGFLISSLLSTNRVSIVSYNLFFLLWIFYAYYIMSDNVLYLQVKYLWQSFIHIALYYNQSLHIWQQYVIVQCTLYMMFWSESGVAWLGGWPQAQMSGLPGTRQPWRFKERFLKLVLSQFMTLKVLFGLFVTYCVSKK